MKKKIISYDRHGKRKDKYLTYIPIRYILAMLITVLEIAAMIGIVIFLCMRVRFFYIAAILTEFGCVLRIIASDDNPDYKVPWLLVVLILPVVGFMLYLIFSSRKLKPKYVRRLRQIEEEGYHKDDSEELELLSQRDIEASRQAKMLCDISNTHLHICEGARYFPIGEDMWEALLRDLRGAKKFIYMEYFIIEEGEFWCSVLEILKQKVAEGVEVKVVYDDVGCMKTLPGNYARRLRAYGIEAVPFSRLRGQADSEFNNRSHRKITVIDGEIGYTGGINIADEYVNLINKYGHWKDTGIRIVGEAVNEMTKLFLWDFSMNVRQMPKPLSDLYSERDTADARGGFIIPFGDGPKPIYERQVAKSALQNMLYTAKEYMYMATPYLIIDNDLCQSIENAALRGVDVRIILPHIPDKKLVFMMSRSYYNRLMRAGVKIYEYTPGFIHSKCYVCDGRYAIVGTVNLDYRSLVHHFENGVWMYDTECIADIKRDMDGTLEACSQVNTSQLRFGPLTRFLRSLIRIFAPLL